MLVALTEAGLPLRWNTTTFLAPALGGFLPLGITAGMFVSVLQEVIAAQAAMRRNEERMRETEKLESVGQLAGGVAHDFNNLLTVINGFAELVLEQLPEGDSALAGVTQIKKAGERASSLTRQLLAFSRKQVLDPKVISLNDAVRNEEPILRRIVREDTQWRTVYAPDAGLVLADRHQLSQVLVNLVVNARDATPAGGTISVETASWVGPPTASNNLDEPHGRCVTVSVTDTGVGMDAATKARLFEPFFTTKPRDQGTGLGLASVYGIVRQSGGWIRAESEPGKGSRFTIYLPQVEGSGSESGTTTLSTLAARGSETVLIVEDQDEVRQFEVSVLESRGYKVLEAASGAAALKLVAEYRDPIDLLLADLVMPGMNGRELARQLEDLRPSMKVLYISGYAANVIAREGMSNIGMALLPKPFTGSQLTDRVREVLATPARADRQK
jgi:signal transduction histidine kinase/CheY-like chemotaxis protein